MNTKETRKMLNVAFKQFQPLPDVVPVKMISPRWDLDETPKNNEQAPRSQRNYDEQRIRIL